MQSYPLHTHNIVLFLVSSWKQTFGVRRVVSVADRAWENIDLTFISLWVRHSILITSTFGNCYDDSLHLGIINIAHTFIWLPVSFVFPNHKQFIRVNNMLYIAHTFIWLLVSFVPPHRNKLIELNRMPCIAHATKIWTVFDASSIGNVLHPFDGYFTPPFAIMASHIVSSKVLWS